MRWGIRRPVRRGVRVSFFKNGAGSILVWGHQPPPKNLMIRIFCGPYRALGPCRPSCDILVTFSGPTGPGGCLGPPGTHWQCPSTCCGQLLGFDLLGGCGRPTQPTEATDVATCQVAGARRWLFSEHKRKEKKRKAPPARHCMCQMSDLWHCASRNHPKATHMCPPYLNHH